MAINHSFMAPLLNGQEVHYHRNSVLDGMFDLLQPGAEVRFVLHEGEGDQGALAGTLVVVGKHHPTSAAP